MKYYGIDWQKMHSLDNEFNSAVKNNCRSFRVFKRWHAVATLVYVMSSVCLTACPGKKIDMASPPSSFFDQFSGLRNSKGINAGTKSYDNPAANSLVIQKLNYNHIEDRLLITLDGRVSFSSILHPIIIKRIYPCL